MKFETLMIRTMRSICDALLHLTINSPKSMGLMTAMDELNDAKRDILVGEHKEKQSKEKPPIPSHLYYLLKVQGSVSFLRAIDVLTDTAAAGKENYINSNAVNAQLALWIDAIVAEKKKEA